MTFQTIIFASGIFASGASEMSRMVGALTEIIHGYGIPAFGTAGCSNTADNI